MINKTKKFIISEELFVSIDTFNDFYRRMCIKLQK